MKVRPLQIRLRWLCFAAYLLTGLFGGRGLVLCLGPGGHVALEAQTAVDCGGCVESAPLPGPNASQRVVDESPACPCDDVALSTDELVARRSEDSRVNDMLDAALPVAVAAFAITTRVEQRCPAHDRCADAVRASRTRPRGVVLRV